MSSVELAELRQRVQELRARLLPSKWPLVATPSQSERARAFTLMAHAEVETYLEKSVLGFVDRRTSEWISSGKLSPCIVALAKTARRNAEVTADADKLSTFDVVVLGKKQLSHFITTSNHGVREKNLKRMLLPAGIELAALPSGFAPTLDAWGARRGGFAHKGGYVTIANPKDEYDTVRLIVKYLASLDKTLRA